MIFDLSNVEDAKSNLYMSAKKSYEEYLHDYKTLFLNIIKLIGVCSVIGLAGFIFSLITCFLCYLVLLSNDFSNKTIFISLCIGLVIFLICLVFVVYTSVLEYRNVKREYHDIRDSIDVFFNMICSKDSSLSNYVNNRIESVYKNILDCIKLNKYNILSCNLDCCMLNVRYTDEDSNVRYAHLTVADEIENISIKEDILKVEKDGSLCYYKRVKG